MSDNAQRASEHSFTLELAVRDYECDLQGIVNNAVYLHYLEHARHEYLRSKGVDFASLAHEGVYLVVVRMEIDYVQALRSGDRFVVSVDLEPVSPLRVAFVQNVHRLPDMKPVVRARTIGTGIDARGRPSIPAAVRKLVGN